MWHATLALVFACLAVPVHAQCPWKDDGDLATGLSDSRWLITGDRHWLINGGSMQIQPTPYQRSLTIGALLREVQLDGDSYDLRLIAPISDEDLIQNMGRNTVSFPMPALPTGECGDLGLSDISISGPADNPGFAS